jgi:hypothetical protein
MVSGLDLLNITLVASEIQIRQLQLLAETPQSALVRPCPDQQQPNLAAVASAVGLEPVPPNLAPSTPAPIGRRRPRNARGITRPRQPDPLEHIICERAYDEVSYQTWHTLPMSELEQVRTQIECGD